MGLCDQGQGATQNKHLLCNDRKCVNAFFALLLIAQGIVIETLLVFTLYFLTADC